MTHPETVLQLLAPLLAGGWALHAHRLYQRLHRGRKDPLTGLLTRDGWTRAAERVIRRHPGATVLLADLNGFKAVNDRHGHDAGDAVLAAAGERLAAWCGKNGVAGRLGGDEFVAILTDDTRLPDRMADLAETLRQPVGHHGLQLRVGASIGAARLAELDTPTLAAALKAADTAMYRVKGRTRRGRRLLAPAAAAVRRRIPQRFRLAA
ncbi:diguanylate cyclase (GGDEF) domain-containing protein [Streptomyces sp. DI166]|uniref:GGDEF domain-containing protein n=1 Tax=Streptomyces sp. FQ1 TaxID=319426 RepID=Q58IK7_9ACTN|nr:MULTISPECIES: GGDEF domain-containing protein [unclassified Streptomyces]AAX51376.1 unknown [Streptomyces sp. FQ1]SBT93979.1 diguanylate cyclase (GGDEF) domain-containing protein [Streptomyces sp. DI166]